MDFRKLHEQLVAKGYNDDTADAKIAHDIVLGPVSTRFKDVYDMYYLRTRVRRAILRKLLQTYIFEDAKLRETDTSAIISRLNRIFKDKGFLKGLREPAFAWLDVPAEEATKAIVDFLATL